MCGTSPNFLAVFDSSRRRAVSRRCYLLSNGSGPCGIADRCLSQETNDESREAGGQTTRSIQNDLRRYSTNWSRWTYTSNRFAGYAGTETACPFLAHMTPLRERARAMGPSRLHPSYRWVEVAVASHRCAPGSEVGRSAGFSYRLARLFLLPRRWSHRAGSPKSDHLLCTFRHDGRRSALCFRSRSATCRPHYGIGSAQPHTHHWVLLEPGISHLLSFPVRIRSRLTTHPSPGRGRAFIHPDKPPCPLLRRPSASRGAYGAPLITV